MKILAREWKSALKLIKESPELSIVYRRKQKIPYSFQIDIYFVVRFVLKF